MKFLISAKYNNPAFSIATSFQYFSIPSTEMALPGYDKKKQNSPTKSSRSSAVMEG